MLIDGLIVYQTQFAIRPEEGLEAAKAKAIELTMDYPRKEMARLKKEIAEVEYIQSMLNEMKGE